MSSSTSYQEILDNNPIAIIAFDSNYFINYANNAANRLAELIKEKPSIVGVGLSELGFDDIQISPTSISNNQILINQMGTLQITYSSLPDSGFVAELTELDSTSELSTQAIKKVIHKISQGEFSARLQSDKFRKQDQHESEFMNECFDKIEEAIENLFHDINLMADCNFSESLKTKENGILGDFFTKLTTTSSNLNEALKQTFEFTKIIEKASSEIAADNQVLAKGTHKQTTELIETVASIEELSSAVAHTSQNASSASQLAQSTNQQIKAGQVTVKDMVSAMSAVESSSSKIESIVSVINDIAFQTRILSLNAAVEAARVGDYGRGFAVVAEEVRSLAQRSADAAKEIKKLIYESSEIVQEGKKLAGQVHVQMEQIVSGMDETNQLMQEISTATDEQSKGIELSNRAISNIDAITQKNQSLVKQLNKNTANLDQQVKYLVDTSNIFYLRDDAKGFSHPRHDLAIKIAQDGAESLSKVLQETFDKGRIDLESLFDQDYQAIDNTTPQKFSTRFDRLTDKVFPSIQENILDQHEFVVLACGIDVNGYIPTHNKRFSLPLTGDKEKDLVGNRTKRIFDDRVGLLSGRATKPYTIQTYRRDTGELMFDVSAPIFVAGKHWGGIRIGYRLD